MTIRRGPGPNRQPPLLIRSHASPDTTTVRGLRAVFINWLLKANFLDEPAYMVGKMEWSWGKDTLDVKTTYQERVDWRDSEDGS